MNLIAAGGDIDPAQSVNWLLPPLSELIYGGIASIIIFALIYKFGGPAAKKGMADRTAKIQAELDGLLKHSSRLAPRLKRFVVPPVTSLLSAPVSLPRPMSKPRVAVRGP